MRPDHLTTLVLLSFTWLPAGLPAQWNRGEVLLDRQFAASPGGTLRVTVQDADVEVKPGSSNQATVKVYARARDMEWGREVFQRMRFEAQATGSEIVVTSDHPRIHDRDWPFHDAVGFTVSVTLPRAFNATIRTADGDIMVGDLEGRMDLSTADGDLNVQGLKGPEITLESSDGDIVAESLEAASITVETSDGDVDLREVNGPLRATTADGDIRVHLAKAVSLSVRTVDGDVTIYASPDLAAQVDFRGEDVHVSSVFRWSGERGERRVRGTLNGGGPLLTATTGDGSISLRPEAR